MNTIQILYFARLREVLGRAEEHLTLPVEVITVRDLLAFLCARGADWESELGGARVFRVAINQELAFPGDVIPPQAEVAIFPPVTGG